MTLPTLTDDRISASEAVGESLQRTTMLKHSEATRNLKRKPAPISRLDQPVTIQLDADLMPSLLDQFGASGQESFEVWLSSFVTDALRGQLGL
jgi:hypothetical protein